jgi:putative ABC transport system permease protein
MRSNIINISLIRFAFTLLVKDFSKHLLTFILFFVIVFLISAVLFMGSSLKNTMIEIAKGEPEILVQKFHGGKSALIDDYWIEPLAHLKGVSNATTRIEGYYRFEPANRSFKIIGIDLLGEKTDNYLHFLFYPKNIRATLNKDTIFIGNTVKKSLQMYYYHDHFTFFLPNGEERKVSMLPLDDSAFRFMSSDLIVCDVSLAREILGMEPFEYSDLYLSVPNDTEIPNLVAKIREIYPDAKVTTKEDTIFQINELIDFKGGLFLSLYLTSILSFSILMYQKTLFAFFGERQEIGILRALGWSIRDIIALKTLQNLFISLSAYSIGVIGAYVYVFVFDAPVLKNIFLKEVGVPFDEIFLPHISLMELSMVFISTVIPFIAATLYPIWKLSTIDPVEAMK